MSASQPGAATQRPLTVTIIGCVFIAAGLVGLIYHAGEYNPNHAVRSELVWVALVRIAAVVVGACMLRGLNWARWGSLLWLAYHVLLSMFHSRTEFVTHVVLLAVFAWLLTRPGVTQYFRAPRTDQAKRKMT